MAIKKFFASKDNTITDGYGSVRTTRATDANMGASDILEVYSLYGSFNSSSLEKSRILLQFDTSDLAAKRTAGDIPASGSTTFFLKLTNAPHVGTYATDFTLTINALSQTWDEGIGLDMDEYLDRGVSNWLTASSTGGTTYTTWATTGSSYHVNPEYTATFTTGLENLSVDVTTLVEQWLAGTKSNYGFLIKLTSTQENGAGNTIASSSYYSTKFFGRGSEYFFKRPTLQAEWNSSKGDDRGNFYASSSIAAEDENTNTLYLYNRVRGQLRNLPDMTGTIYVNYYDALTSSAGLSTSDTEIINTSAVTGGWVNTGIYSASSILDTTASIVYDVWFSGSTQYHTGSPISVKDFAMSDYNPDSQHVINITNLRATYSTSEKQRIRLFIRDKGWNPTIYTTATSKITSKIVEKVYYSVTRVVDNWEVIPYATASTSGTLMSYDVSGSYTDLDFSNFEKGYQYEIAFKLYLQGKYIEPTDTFKFRVE
tara:strand:- start:19483 stop:20931 length:1449 start_codon:yes stop_codon:yes gene_type:complete